MVGGTIRGRKIKERRFKLKLDLCITFLYKWDN